MRLVALASGSSGNATLVEFGETRVLVDAGVSARRLERELRACDVEPDALAGILLTHEHTDHTRGAETFSRKHGVPVFCAVETLEAMDHSPAHFADWQALACDRRADLGAVQVESFPVPHDAVQPLGFVLHGEGLRVGIATDLGHATTLVVERLRGCHVLMVESNHDDRMLRDGPYPWHLKQRVSGRLGHLSNREAAGMLDLVVNDDCRAVVLAHLSGNNNTPDLARRAAESVLAVGGREIDVRVAERDRLSPAVEL